MRKLSSRFLIAATITATGIAVSSENVAYLTGEQEVIVKLDLTTGKKLDAISVSTVAGFQTAVGPVTLDGPDLYFAHWGVARYDETTRKLIQFKRIPVQLPTGQVIGLPKSPGQIEVSNDSRIFVADDQYGVAVLEKSSGDLIAYYNADPTANDQPTQGKFLQLLGDQIIIAGQYAYTIFTLTTP